MDCANRQPVARLGFGIRDLACDVHALLAGGKKGVWQRILGAIRHDADWEALRMDSTVVRAHQHAAGAPKKTARTCSGARAAG